MKINENHIVVNGQLIGTYDLYDANRLACRLTSDKATQEAIQQGANTTLEVLHNALDYRIVTSFEIIHK